MRRAKEREGRERGGRKLAGRGRIRAREGGRKEGEEKRKG